MAALLFPVGSALAIPVGHDDCVVETTLIPVNLDLLGDLRLHLGGGAVTPLESGAFDLAASAFDLDLEEFTGQVQYDRVNFALKASSGEKLLFKDFTLDLTEAVVRADLSLFQDSTVIDFEPGVSVFDVRVCALSSGVDPCLGPDGEEVDPGDALALGLSISDTFEYLLEDLGLDGELFGQDLGVLLLDKTVVPEPGTAALLLAGLLGLTRAGRRHRD
ncbi:MAG: PEP-CTERM sorting domain-containing protein [Proteobacteria bacterium]|nr:PEP-CTERM sorting domain-containing protein [Pseudomonadota bacterium]